MNSKIFFTSILIILYPLFLQAAESAAERPDFSKYRNQRQQIIGELDSAKSELQRVEDGVKGLPRVTEIEGYLKKTTREVDDIKSQIEIEKKGKIPDQFKLQRLNEDQKFNEGQVERYQNDIDRKKVADKDGERLRATIRGKEKELQDIESSIAEALARDVVAQNFKSQISLYFALLVGFMILCFFGVAFYDANVRITIFSGQAGMQFVTLFSLIIAIILFGITGILADKELAALLGGLSGYILGKYNHDNSKDQTNNLPTGKLSDPKPPPAA